MEYNSIMMKRFNFKPYVETPKFWGDVEYCTWVEQKTQSKVKRGHFNLLTHDFVESYLDKIIDYGYPKGKMTLDHGWGQFPDGSINSGFGTWYPVPKKFPDFRKTMDMIQNKGFTPGLWIAFPKIHHASAIAQKYPDMLGDWRANKEINREKDERWLNTKPDMLHIHKELFPFN